MERTVELLSKLVGASFANQKFSMDQLQATISKTVSKAENTDWSDWFKSFMLISVGALLGKVGEMVFFKAEPSKKKIVLQGFNLDTHVISPMKLKFSYKDRAVIGKAKVEKTDSKLDITGSFEGDLIQLWLTIPDEKADKKGFRYAIKGEIMGNQFRGTSEDLETKEYKNLQVNIIKSVAYTKVAAY